MPLKRQIPFGKPIIGAEEKLAVAQVLNGDTLVHGPKAKEFEGVFAHYTQAPHALSVSSCTAGLHLAYFYLGIAPGDEVVVPAETHVATAHAVELCGGKPVFVDADPKTGNINIDQIESAITSQTKAISVVHYLGMPVDMVKVMTIAAKRGLFVVEDCALAVGAQIDGTHVGLWGNLGCFSFYPVKHLTTAEGGMIITKHREIADRIKFQKAFGVDKTPGERPVPGVYDVLMLGFNYRMNEIEAAIGIEQMKKMNGFQTQRQKNYAVLRKKLEEISEIDLFHHQSDRLKNSHYCLSVLLKGPLAKKRTEVLVNLKENGVGGSVYYPKAVPHFTYYREKYGYDLASYPAAKLIGDTSVALPVGPHLTEDDMIYVADTLKEVITKLK